jgi:hypothetical protein
MSLESLIDGYLAGEKVEVPPEQREEFDRAVKGHEAL